MGLRRFTIGLDDVSSRDLSRLRALSERGEGEKWREKYQLITASLV